MPPVTFDPQFLSDPRLAAALWAGVKTTLLLAVLSALGSFLLGVLLTAAQVTGSEIVSQAARGYINVARNVPLLIVMFFLYFGGTSLFPPSDYSFMRHLRLGETTVVLAITAVSGAFIAEVLRQGIEAVPVGQFEAALATGLAPTSIYQHVIIPQLVQIVLPGLASETVNVIKGTSFAMTLGVADLMWHGQDLESETFKGVEIMTAVSAVYFLISFVTIASFRALEHVLLRSRTIAR